MQSTPAEVAPIAASTIAKSLTALGEHVEEVRDPMEEHLAGVHDQEILAQFYANYGEADPRK